MKRRTPSHLAHHYFMSVTLSEEFVSTLSSEEKEQLAKRPSNEIAPGWRRYSGFPIQVAGQWSRRFQVWEWEKKQSK